MLEARNKAVEFARSQNDSYLRDLVDFLKIPSISTDPNHSQDMFKAASWLVEELKEMGFSQTQTIQTPRHPIVYSEFMVNPALPTVLVYGHYDVQPVDPLDLWESHPFHPEIRGENLYARGASDMKGQVNAVLSAIKSILAAGKPPVNLKFLIEGEEEIGSPNLVSFLINQKNNLQCTLALNPDSGMIDAQTPTVVYGLRGLAYFEVKVFGPAQDLHSGLYGGVVHNPANVLAELIAGMHDESGRITLPGFYDQVVELKPEERQALALLPMTEDYYKKIIGAPALWGEEGYSPVERVSARPTLDVNGLYSGFIGSGSKTVIPSWAMAKISMRLVPNQDPAEIQKSLAKYLTDHAPKTVRWEVQTFAGNPACLVDLKFPAVKAMHSALKEVWGVDPSYKREGGSIPVVMDMQKILGVESVITGFGLPDDNLHAPNEKIHLPTWRRGIQSLIHFFYNLPERFN